MRKSLTVVLVVLVLAALSVPASAYVVNWFDGFESYAPGPLHGQGPWVATNPSTSPIVTGSPVYGGGKAAKQVVGASGAAADLRFLNPRYSAYQSGYARFWVYDPGDISGQVTDGRVGVHSSAGADSVSKMFTAGVRSSRSSSYWDIGWSYSLVLADGVSAASGTGYSFTPGPAAPRIWNSWSSVIIRWSFLNDPGGGGRARIQWFVNQTWTPNMTLQFDSTTNRWANTHDIAGVFIGSLYSQSNPTTYDSVEFHFIPEPSSLLALGGGIIGLLGLIRRRR